MSQESKMKNFASACMFLAALSMAVPSQAFAAAAEQADAPTAEVQAAPAEAQEKTTPEAQAAPAEAQEKTTPEAAASAQQKAKVESQKSADADHSGDEELDWRCTGMYVGQDLTETGDAYVGRIEDLNGHNHKVYEYVRPQDNNPETDFYINGETNGQDDVNSPDFKGFKLPKPKHTYGYVCYHDDNQNPDWLADNPKGYPLYAACGINDNGVAVTATTSIYPKYPLVKDSKDPYVESGVAEAVLGDILLGQAKNPRQACQLAGSIVDKWGSAEGNQVYVANADETWVFSILSGHQWIAFKMPSDKAMINPNIGGLQYKVDLNDTENVMYSKDLVKLAEEHGFAKYYEDGTFNVFSTYGEDPAGAQGVRLWQGYDYFTNAKTADDLMAEHPFFFTPDNKNLSTFDIVRAFGFRGQGTKYDATLPEYDNWFQSQWTKDAKGQWVETRVDAPYREKSKYYSIGNMNNLQEHVFQVRQDKSIPLGLRIIQWECMGPAEWGLFLPLYNGLVTQTSDIYSSKNCEHDNEAADVVNKVAQKDMYFTMGDFNYLINYARWKGADMSAIRQFIDANQKDIIAQQAVMEKAMMSLPKEQYTAAANALSKVMSEQVQKRINDMNTQLRAFIESGRTADGINLSGKKFTFADTSNIVDLSSLIKDGKFMENSFAPAKLRDLGYDPTAAETPEPDYSKEIDALNKQISEMKNLISKLNKELEDKKQEIADNQDTIKGLQDTIAAKEKAAKELQGMIDALSHRIAESKDENKVLKDQLAQAVDALKSVQDELARLQNELANMNKPEEKPEEKPELPKADESKDEKTTAAPKHMAETKVDAAATPATADVTFIAAPVMSALAGFGALVLGRRKRDK